MAPKKSTIVLNVEQFIRDVEQRPAIWNRNVHCNKAFLEQMWDELSSEHKLPKVVLKAKWKGLRDNFRVEYKRIPRADNGDFLVEPATFGSKWIHYYALLFLTEHMRHPVPKNEQDQAFFFAQQSQDCEKTVVEPDPTNSLIRRLQDSDEEFDEDDVDEVDDEVTETTPPAAHSQSLTSVVNGVPGAIIKLEDNRKIFDKEVTALQPQQQQATTISSTTAVSPSVLPLSLTTNLPIAFMLPNTCLFNGSVGGVPPSGGQQKIRSVSLPPLYYKGQGPPLKLKRPLLLEDSNFNGPSSMDTSNAATPTPLVPEDDDYHYLFVEFDEDDPPPSSNNNGLLPPLKLIRP